MIIRVIYNLYVIDYHYGVCSGCDAVYSHLDIIDDLWNVIVSSPASYRKVAVVKPRLS